MRPTMQRLFRNVGRSGAAVLLLGTAFACSAESDDSTLDWTTQLLAGFGWNDSNNGTVTDSNTGLTWMKCAHGQVWNAGLNNCAGTGGGTTYGAKSVQFCEAVSDNSLTECVSSDALYPVATSGPAYQACVDSRAGDFSNWRLPTYVELEALAANKDRTTFEYYFPETPDDKPFWTASGDSSSSGDNAYAVAFSSANWGVRESYEKASTVHYVRCVRP